MKCEASTGNVYADLELPNADKLLEESAERLRTSYITAKEKLERMENSVNILLNHDEFIEDMYEQIKFIEDMSDNISMMYEDKFKCRYEDERKICEDSLDKFSDYITNQIGRSVCGMIRSRNYLRDYTKKDSPIQEAIQETPVEFKEKQYIGKHNSVPPYIIELINLLNNEISRWIEFSGEIANERIKELLKRDGH